MFNLAAAAVKLGSKLPEDDFGSKGDNLPLLFLEEGSWEYSLANLPKFSSVGSASNFFKTSLAVFSSLAKINWTEILGE